MAMDDIEKLVGAIMVHGAMYRPAKVDGLLLVGPWTKAEIVEVTLSFDHRSYPLGAVRYRIEGEETCKQASFFDLMTEAWTLDPKLWPSAVEAEREKKIRAEVRRRLRAARTPTKKHSSRRTRRA